MPTIDINVDEPFPTLRHPPSVEAVIDIRVVPATPPTEDSLRNYVQSKFGDYRFWDSQKEIQFQFQFGLAPASAQAPNQTTREGWKGVRFRSNDQKYIAQFNRDGFILSRLRPYESWPQLLHEAVRLWAGYAEFVKPVQIVRIGLRYVNVIQMPAGESQFGNYLKVVPAVPEGLDWQIVGFMHQDALTVPDYPYAVNVIKTVQPPNPGYSLILDIDVSTTEPFECNDSMLNQRLTEMRWLKNKVFFGSIQPKSERLFK